MVIGLTGGIASGKSTVSNILRDLGAYIIDADMIAHSVLKKGTVGWEKVVDQFGTNILSKDGTINRKLLGDIVFSDGNKLRVLENIVHPLIVIEIKSKLKEITEDNRVIVLDAPLLYETNLDNLVDQVWVVYVDRATQLYRLQERDGLSRLQAIKRIESQMPLKIKKEKADIVINNKGNKKELRNKVVRLWKQQ